MKIPKMTKTQIDEAKQWAEFIGRRSEILGTVVDPKLSAVINNYCTAAQISLTTFAEDVAFEGLNAVQRLAVILCICDVTKSVTYYDENAAANALQTDIVFIRKLMALIFDEIGIDL